MPRPSCSLATLRAADRVIGYYPKPQSASSLSVDWGCVFFLNCLPKVCVPGALCSSSIAAHDIRRCLTPPHSTPSHPGTNRVLFCVLLVMQRYVQQIPRGSLALIWELPSNGKPAKKALSPSRAMVHLDRLLMYHELKYVDAFIFEIPWFKGGEVRPVFTVLCHVCVACDAKREHTITVVVGRPSCPGYWSPRTNARAACACRRIELEIVGLVGVSNSVSRGWPLCSSSF